MVTSGAQVLHKVKGFEMRRIVTGLNRYSNNFIADTLLKDLDAYFGAKKTPKPASLAGGLGVVTEFLQKEVGLNGSIQIFNGSGLDTRNRLSAAQMVTFLRYMANRFDLFPDFLASLPASGWDGTLKRRFARGNLRKLAGMVRAKTGSLSQPIAVSSLAGYFQHDRHGLVAFAIIENGVPTKPQPSVAALRSGQDMAVYNILTKF